ncbi:HD domain-containing protein [Planosporangium sp. 12N6]|uniref:HD domain-containing protein n=1 Tax=Planosporangium spinosum TaxID=3402278 RepID=UPI003CEB1CD1
MERLPWARDLARRLLAEPLPRRWAHTQGVGHRAESIASIAGEDTELLICAAWLHDIGYAPDLVKTGFHPLDGARYLRDVERADDALCALVANHSCAVIEARNRNLLHELTTEFPEPSGPILDALTYCDMTTSPDGGITSVTERLDEIFSRYEEGTVVNLSMREARPRILDVERKIGALLASSPANP